jgi:hypothetical protein
MQHSIDTTVEIFAVRCTGCDRYFLGGTGRKDDPVMDVTYQYELAEFVCPPCYSTDSKRVYN